MKRTATLLLSFFFLSVLPGSLKAQPLAGMDLTLTCVGGNDYEARFVYYRDCVGIAAPTNISLLFFCTSNPSYNFSITQVPRLPGTGQEITPACSLMPTKCSIGSNTGYQEYVYQAQVTLPPCNYWRISNISCCRVNSQTTTPFSGESGYIEATLNNLDFPGNSSPVFTGNPIRIMCTGQTNIINHGAIDPDGDSLSYTMVTPFTNSNNSFLNWIIPFSATQPIASNPPVTLNPVTGQIIMTPTTNITSLMALKIDQWRYLNGVPTIVGTSYRDIKLNSITCSNQNPVLSGMDTTLINGYDPGDTIFYKEVCPGDTVSFAIWGHDSDTANILPGNSELFKIFWNQGIPQASFQVFNQDTDSAYAIFNWVPASADKKLHCFTVTIQDYACPYYGMQTYTYCILVNGTSVTVTPDTSVCHGSSVTFYAVADPPAADYIWRVDGVPVFTPAPSNSLHISTQSMSEGLHVVSVETTGLNPSAICSGKANASLIVYPIPQVFLGNDTNIAPGESIILNAGPGFSSYLWSTGHTGQYFLVDSSGNGLGIKTVWAEVTDNNNCKGSDTIKINFVKNPGIDEPSENEKLIIYPNPSEGHLVLHFNGFPAGNYDFGIYSRDGRLVYIATITLSGQSDIITFSPENIADGFYYLKIKGEGRVASGKFILSR